MITSDSTKKTFLLRIWESVTTHWRQIGRAFWWAVSLSTSIYLIAARFDKVISDKPTTFDIGLLGFTVVLILLPFISEISAFGFTIKKQLEEVKKELRQDIKDETQSIRNEILAIGISNKLTSNVVLQTGLPNPPPDNELAEIRNQITEVLRQFQEQRGMRDLPPLHVDVSPNTIFAFQQRYLVEREIKRIWSTRIKNGDFYRYPPFSRMVEDLVRFELITSNLGGSLKEVFSVASSAVDGDEPSLEKISFLQEVAPDILATLNSIR